MPKLNKIIKNQRISFDTHQAGDGQETQWRNVHLEKSVIGKKGKVRFPFLGKERPSNSGITDSEFNKIVREVTKVLKKNKSILESLSETIENVLERFSAGTATIDDAKEAAKRFAEYFDLDENFIDEVSIYRKNRLIKFNTIHEDNLDGKFYSIKLSKKNILIEERKTYYFR